MISLRIKFQGRKVRIKGFGIRPLKMLQLGAAALAIVKARVARGQDINDTPMPGLSESYGKRKRRRFSRDLRDLRLTGAMLDNLTVRSATENQVRIAFTKALERQKALSNQQRTPWLGWSPNDTREIEDAAQRIFKTEVEAYFRELKRQFSRRPAPAAVRPVSFTFTDPTTGQSISFGRSA